MGKTYKDSKFSSKLREEFKERPRPRRKAKLEPYSRNSFKRG